MTIATAAPNIGNAAPSTEKEDVVLDVRGVRKSYGSKVALHGLDMCLRAGEFVALLGPNGAGKSTLIQLLSGLFVPDAGQIVVMGCNLRQHAPRALAQLGVVFQQSSLDLDLSVRSNLLFHTDLHGLPRSLAHQRMDAGLRQHGLVDQAGQPVRGLSGGNRRKVELIRALLHQPRFLLMDEATVGLDPASRHELIASVQALAAQHRMAVLWTTHLVEEVTQADRLLILNQGQLSYDGTPADLCARHPGHTLEQAFLASCRAPR